LEADKKINLALKVSVIVHAAEASRTTAQGYAITQPVKRSSLVIQPEPKHSGDMNSRGVNISVKNEDDRQSGKRLTGVTGMRRLPMAFYNLIAAQPLFEGLSPDQLILLAHSATEINFAPGQFIFEKEVSANRFYLILEGEVELRSEAKHHGTISLQIFGPGQTLGWTWLFPQEHMFPPYHILSSARATGRTKALFFCTTWLRKQCHEDRALGYQLTNRIAEVVTETLKHIGQRLLSMTTQPCPCAESPSQDSGLTNSTRRFTFRADPTTL
jgi:CRP-like cAMP-binding protein